MNMRRVAAGLAIMGPLLVVSAYAQGLGDQAAKERAKRAQKQQANQPGAKQFTNDDLDKGKPPGAKAVAGEDAAPAQGAESGSPEAAPIDDRQQQERALLDGISGAQAQVAAAESRIRQLSGKLNPMSTDFIYGSGGSNDANEELRVRDELRQAEEQLLAARQAVAAASRSLQDFRSGRPSGSADH